MITEPNLRVWHVADGEAHYGPLSINDVKRLLSIGTVGRNALVWSAAQGEWLPILKAPEFAVLAVGLASPVSPSFESLAPLAHPSPFEAVPESVSSVGPESEFPEALFGPQSKVEQGNAGLGAGSRGPTGKGLRPLLAAVALGVLVLGTVGVVRMGSHVAASWAEGGGGVRGPLALGVPSGAGGVSRATLVRLSTDVIGALTKEAVRGVATKHGTRLESVCGGTARQNREANAPDIAVVSAEITIGPAGTVEKAHAADPKGYRDLAACVLKQMEGWQFPSASGSTRARVGITLATR